MAQFSSLSVVLIVVACVAMGSAQARAQPMPSLGFWNWLEAVVDPDLPLCQSAFENLVSGSRTGPYLAQDGHVFLSTNYMFICHNPNATRRFAALDSWMDSLMSKYGITVDLLFTQSSDSNIPTGAPRWLSVAIPFVKARQAAGKPTPAFRFDVEYLPTSADAERVLKLAEVVRTTVDSAWPDASQRPLISWAVNTAAAMNLNTSQVTCPVSGKAALIAECFFEIVDSLTVMDYRSFAVQEPSPKTACDGMAIRGGPFFTMAAAAGKRVSLAAETSCDLGSKYQFKISYCAKGQLYHTNEPLEYMYTALNDTRNALEDTSATLKQYPCAGQQEAPVVSLKPNQHLWNQQTVASPNMVIEDAHAWETLAYGTTTITDNCSYQDFSWQSCM